MTSPGGSTVGPGGYGGPGTTPAPSSSGNGLAADVHTLERAIFVVKRIIVGQDRVLERLPVGLLPRGHLLLEGVPDAQAQRLRDMIELNLGALGQDGIEEMIIPDALAEERLQMLRKRMKDALEEASNMR